MFCNVFAVPISKQKRAGVELLKYIISSEKSGRNINEICKQNNIMFFTNCSFGVLNYTKISDVNSRSRALGKRKAHTTAPPKRYFAAVAIYDSIKSLIT